MTPVEERIDHERRLRQFIEANRREGKSAVFSYHRLYFEDIEALLTEHSAREELLATAADALHDAAWVMSGEAKPSPPLPPPVKLVLPQTKRVEAEIRAALSEPDVLIHSHYWACGCAAPDGSGERCGKPVGHEPSQHVSVEGSEWRAALPATESAQPEEERRG